MCVEKEKAAAVRHQTKGVGQVLGFPDGLVRVRSIAAFVLDPPPCEDCMAPQIIIRSK